MVVLVVVLIGLVTVMVLVAVGLVSGRSTGPVDIDRTEHWIVQRVEHVAWLHRIVVRADHAVIGGAAVAVALLWTWSIGLIVGSIFDSIDSGGGFARWDKAVAQWGATHVGSSSGLIDLLVACTQLGATAVVLTVLTVLGVIESIRRHRPAIAGYLATVGLGVVALNNTIKWLVDRDRPPVPHLTGSAGSSFPSGHSATSAACWAAVALMLSQHVPVRHRRLLGVAAVAVTVAVAASRALLGVHWLTDVIAGVAIGWGWFFLVTIIFGGRILRLGEPVERLQRRAAHDATVTSTRPVDRRKGVASIRESARACTEKACTEKSARSSRRGPSTRSGRIG